ncbi:MAG: hypothetical protein AAGB93_08155 [Planctomycetota bacterium]
MTSYDTKFRITPSITGSPNLSADYVGIPIPNWVHVAMAKYFTLAATDPGALILDLGQDDTGNEITIESLSFAALVGHAETYAKKILDSNTARVGRRFVDSVSENGKPPWMKSDKGGSMQLLFIGEDGNWTSANVYRELGIVESYWIEVLFEEKN